MRKRYGKTHVIANVIWADCQCSGRGRIAERNGGVSIDRLVAAQFPLHNRELSSTSIVRHIAWIALQAFVAEKPYGPQLCACCSPKKGCGICSMQ